MFQRCDWVSNTPASARPSTIPQSLSRCLGWYRLLVRRSSCLPFQLFWIETLSFLPNHQGDRRNLASQGEAGHGRLHPFGEQGDVEILKGPGRGTGHRGRTLEQILQIVIMIGIETSQGRLSLGPLQLASAEAVFSADPRLQCQTAVCPQLPFGAESMGSLQ